MPYLQKPGSGEFFGKPNLALRRADCSVHRYVYRWSYSVELVLSRRDPRNINASEPIRHLHFRRKLQCGPFCCQHRTPQREHKAWLHQCYGTAFRARTYIRSGSCMPGSGCKLFCCPCIGRIHLFMERTGHSNYSFRTRQQHRIGTYNRHCCEPLRKGGK
jgi:hypothetical protein